MECTVCGKKAVYTYRYNGTSACREHFMQGFEKRVRQEIRKQIRFRKPETRISVAISGGKDSSVTLYILKKILGERKDVVLSAFTVDEGIEGYRDSGLKASIDLCRSLGIRHDVKSYSEVFGTTMDRVIRIRNDSLKDRIIATYDETGYFTLKTIQIINVKNDNKKELKFLLALLNSKLMNFYCTNCLSWSCIL